MLSITNPRKLDSLYHRHHKHLNDNRTRNILGRWKSTNNLPLKNEKHLQFLMAQIEETIVSLAFKLALINFTTVDLVIPRESLISDICAYHLIDLVVLQGTIGRLYRDLWQCANSRSLSRSLSGPFWFDFCSERRPRILLLIRLYMVVVAQRPKHNFGAETSFRRPMDSPSKS